MKNLRRFLFCCLVLFCAFSQKSNAQCDFTEANLVGGPASFTVPAGQVLCINSNFCMGAASNFPGACANSAVNSLIINGTLRIASGVTFRFAGSINGTGNIQILQGGRINLFGSLNCAGGLAISAVDMSITTGTSTSTPLVSCSSPTCEPKFSNNYAPFGIVTPGLGFTASGCTGITGYPNNNILVPVSLIDFTARRDPAGVLLTWKTASEQDNAGFEVQRLANGSSWEMLGKVTSSAPGGNSNTLLSYSFRDAARLVAATTWYRLKQTDLNGDLQYSNMAQVKEVSENNIRIITVPGAINLEVYSNANQQAQIKIVGSGGGIVHQAQHRLTPGLNRVSVNTSRFAKGMYIVILQTDKESRQEKVRVQ